MLRLRLVKLSKIVLNPFFFSAFLKGAVAGVEHRHVLQLMGDCRAVVDIGANRGQFALAARRWAPMARIIAFEPLPEPADIFLEVFKGDSRVTLHRAAIGSKAGETTIHVSRRDDSSSLLLIGELQEHLFPGTGEIRKETIRVGRLSDFVSAQELTAPAMLKLDMQWFELEALRGCEELLSRFSQVYVECSFVELYAGQALADEVIAWLHERGI